jgi:glycosyltransferase involved in cell wall biosynthesis
MLFPIIFGNEIPVVYERHVSNQITLKLRKLSWLQKLNSKIKAELMNTVVKRFHKFVVLTKGNLEEWDFNNLHEISNPLQFNSDEISTLSNKKVLDIGKQCYQKSYDRLIDSWRIVHNKYPDWQLVVYRKLERELGLEAKVEELKLAENLHFYPPTKSIQEKYQEAAIYIMLARFEGFGMVLIEAMSCGLPAIF